MLQRAQDLFKQVQDRMRNTLQVVADIAESVGVPNSMTSLIQRRDDLSHDDLAWPGDSGSAPGTSAPGADPSYESPVRAEVPRAVAPVEVPAKPAAKKTATKAKTATKKTTQKAKSKTTKSAKGKKTAKRSNKRPLKGNTTASAKVRALQVEDSINSSTYLARIIWSLGVAQLEGLGPLRPADIARMVMARSPVSLEPPNIARYIRRSKPNCIIVDHTEGSSNFYKLNAAGRRLFEEHFNTAL